MFFLKNVSLGTVIFFRSNWDPYHVTFIIEDVWGDGFRPYVREDCFGFYCISSQVIKRVSILCGSVVVVWVLDGSMHGGDISRSGVDAGHWSLVIGHWSFKGAKS